MTSQGPGRQTPTTESRWGWRRPLARSRAAPSTSQAPPSRATNLRRAKVIPTLGAPLSGAIAAAGTYALGKSAEAYFFSDALRRPEEFVGEWGGRGGDE